jgi:hypothetical protein
VYAKVAFLLTVDLGEAAEAGAIHATRHTTASTRQNSFVAILLVFIDIFVPPFIFTQFS